MDYFLWGISAKKIDIMMADASRIEYPEGAEEKKEADPVKLSKEEFKFFLRKHAN